MVSLLFCSVAAVFCFIQQPQHFGAGKGVVQLEHAAADHRQSLINVGIAGLAVSGI